MSLSPSQSVVAEPADLVPAAIDRVLVGRFTGGDERAFVEIVARYREKILRTTLGLLRNHADAEEVTQDTFVRAHRGLSAFRGDSSLSTWLYRIALNLSRNRYWHNYRRRRQDCISLDCALSDGNPATASDLLADAGADPAQEVAAREFSAVVEHSLKFLSSRHREILNMRNVLDRSYEEIAVTLGVSVGTVKSRIARARECLRERVDQHGGTNERLRDWFLPARALSGRARFVRA
jgi:RNA polymerase sigma-70 factor (ECF subfamily)